VPELTPPDGTRELPPTGEHTTGSLGRYKILGELGRGGCGIVYRALDPSIGRMVAIKTILAKTESSVGKESRERFRREARSAGNLSHPNIVTVHDFSDTGDPMFIAMEFIQGRTLAELMSDGPLQLDFIIKILRSAADALDYAHAHHVVHRDVKPANFLIDELGRLKITDFGIAKMLDSDESLTSTGTVVGTVQYMSPEQISETHVTGLSDQFSLAVIAYETLAGVKPFQGNSWATVIHAIIMGEPPNITKYRDTLGEPVNKVLRKALSKDPVARYSTCTEFCNALEQSIADVTLQRTEILPKGPDGRPLGMTVKQEKPPVVNQQPLDPGRETAEPLPPVAKAPLGAKRPPWRSLLIGALSAVLIAAVAWLALRSRNEHQPAPPVQQASPSQQHSAPPVPSQAVSQPASTQQAEATPAPAPELKGKQPAKQVKEQSKAEPVQTVAKPSPAVTAANNQPPHVESAPVVPTPTAAPPVRDLTPAPPPAPAPKKATEEVAKPPADDQVKRAADEQAKRLADEQIKRAADEQTKRLADEQAKNARAADFAAIYRALRDYQTAYEQKDLAALQKIWPSIPKQVLEGIRGSFREATTVSMDLSAVGDPKVSGSTATVVCDRVLRQVILKRPLQATGRVRIVLSRVGSGWMIQSVDSVNP
jgi:serine/threonine protein kinase